MYAKFTTLTLVGMLTIAFVGCGDSKANRRTTKKTAPSSSNETATAPADAKPADAKPAASTEVADASAAPSAAPASGDWGTLKGKFVYNGKAPEPAKLNIDKDQQVCGKHDLVDESLVVGKDGEMANVIVWVRTKDVKIHPDYEAKKKDKAVVDNKNCRFDPHVVTYWTGQPLELKNTDPDPVAHNTNASLAVNEAFNVIIPPQSSIDRPALKLGETIPTKISCNIHPWMQGWLLVQPHPYMAVSGKDGSFELKNLPTGTELEIQVWQEKSGYVQKAEVNGKDAGWAKGRFKYTVKAGDNDLGTIKLDPAQFNK